MALESKGGVLAQGQATTSPVAVYTVAGSRSPIELRKVVFCNVSASPVTVTYGVGKSGASLGAAATLVGKTLAMGAAGSTTHTVDATELQGVVLGLGDFLSVQASADSSVSYTVSAVW